MGGNRDYDSVAGWSWRGGFRWAKDAGGRRRRRTERWWQRFLEAARRRGKGWSVLCSIVCCSCSRPRVLPSSGVVAGSCAQSRFVALILHCLPSLIGVAVHGEYRLSLPLVSPATGRPLVLLVAGDRPRRRSPCRAQRSARALPCMLTSIDEGAVMRWHLGETLSVASSELRAAGHQTLCCCGVEATLRSATRWCQLEAVAKQGSPV